MRIEQLCSIILLRRQKCFVQAESQTSVAREFAVQTNHILWDHCEVLTRLFSNLKNINIVSFSEMSLSLQNSEVEKTSKCCSRSRLWYFCEFRMNDSTAKKLNVFLIYFLTFRFLVFDCFDDDLTNLFKTFSLILNSFGIQFFDW